jgi:hypothetical protein
VSAGNGAGPATRAALDLDARRAARAEAGQETFAFTLFGETYEVRPTADWPLESQNRLAEGEIAGALPGLLVGGADTYRALCAAGATIGDMTDLFNAVAKWAGLENLPNLSAPQRPATTPT